MRRAAWAVALVLVAVSCGGDATTTPPSQTLAAEPTPPPTEPVVWPAEPVIEEVGFTSGDFELVGELMLPGGEGPYPAVIAVTGSGAQTRRGFPGYVQLRNSLVDAGFALFSWDKPGSGGSTGTIEFPITQRSVIVADGAAFLAGRPEIDASRVGFWGLSQAGWVMPKALEQTDDVAFMIVVSGSGEDGIEQTVYRLARQLECMGGSVADGRIVEEEGARAFKATTYQDYRAAAEAVYAVTDIQLIYPFEIAAEGDWSPPSPDQDVESWFDPMTVVRELSIPVLAVFGDMDKNVDPVQGADAYAAAFAAGGHELSRVELIPGVGHTMLSQQTGCIGEPGGLISERYLELLDDWLTRLATEL